MPINVLHIEDNPGDALLLQALLQTVEGETFELAQAERLSAGLTLLGSKTFDIVLLDMSLPDSFGIDTFKRVREKSPHVPVIVLSGLDDEAAAIKTVHAGAQDYLCKDELNERMLLRSIRYAIERHGAEERFESERRLLRALINALPDLIYVKDRQSKFVTCNTAVAHLLGAQSTEDVIGKSDFDFFPQSLAEKFFNEELAVLAGKPRVNREEVVERAGLKRWLLSTKVPLTDREGKITGLVGVNRDITERKQAEERLIRLLGDLERTHEDLKAAQLQLIQAEKMESVGRIAAGVAHEVKNPLAVAVMGLDFVKNSLGSSQPALVPVLKEIYDAIQRADSVIGGLLDFSRPRTLVRAKEEVNEIVQQSLALIRHDLSKKRINLEQNLAEKLPSVFVDANKIKQVFLNLFMNALHAMTYDGTLTVRTFSATARELRDSGMMFPGDRINLDESMVAIRIEDTGTGIMPEYVNKIFDPYFTTKPVGEGTGLGLPVSRQIVELHGGVLDIRNRHDRNGTRATVAIPVTAESAKGP